MSYVNMDHAKWVEMNHAAGRRTTKTPKRDRHGDVVGYHAAPEKLSEFQAKAMNILGIVGGGIYNAPITWGTVDWNCGRGISLIWGERGLSTFDASGLTKFVFLCHEARIRSNITPAGPRMFRITMHPRSHDGGTYDRHPSLEEAVASFRQEMGEDHSIRYRMPEPIDVAA